MRRSLPVVVAVAAAACLTATAAGGAASKPTIGAPVASPTKPLAGSSFKVSFHVAHATSAKFTVTLGGKAQRHSDSFRSGIARTSVALPSAAAGKALAVTLTARAGTATATKHVAFVVRAAGTPPSLAIDDHAAAEGNSGTTPFSFDVTLSHAATQAVTVAYATANGTATAPSDYTPANGTLTFNPGQTAKTITVAVVGDTTREADENFTVTLSHPVNATIDAGVGTGTITNDDVANAGSWQGATQEGNYVFFTVTPDHAITGFRTNSLTESCNGGSASLTGSLDWGTQSFPIADDATFLAQYSWTGSQTTNGVELTAETWKLTGTFSTPTAISGTIAIADEENYQGTHYSCSGSVTFTATFQG